MNGTTEQRNVQVPIPELIKQYNAGMGGVDQLDSQVALQSSFPYQEVVLPSLPGALL